MELPEDIKTLYDNLSDDYFEKIEENMKSIISFSNGEFEKYMTGIINELNIMESFKSEMTSTNDKYLESEMLIKNRLKDRAVWLKPLV